MSTTPEILLYTDIESDESHVFNMLKDNFDHCVSVHTQDQLLKLFNQGKTRIILLGCEQISDSLLVYSEILHHVPKILITNQKTILLVHENEEKDAFEIYAEGLVDDYIISRPDLNIQRLLSIIMHEFIELGDLSHKSLSHADSNFTTDLKTCILTSIKKKKEVKMAFETAVKKLEDDVDEVTKRLKANEFEGLSEVVDLQKINKVLCQFKSAELRPTLIPLEQKLLKLLSLSLQKINLPKQKSNAEIQHVNNEPQVKMNDHAKPIDNACYKGKNILLVDDNHTSQDFIRNFAKTAQQKITIITNGRAAMTRLERESFDLIIMNVSLPDSDGIRLVDSIKKTTTKSDGSLFVMLAPSSNKDAINRCKNIEDIQGIITTPLNKSEVKSTYLKVFSI